MQPAEAGDDAIHGALLLDLDHRARSGLVAEVAMLGDDAVDSGTDVEPLGRATLVVRDLRQLQRRRGGGEELFQQPPSFDKRPGAHVDIVVGDQVERHERRRRLGTEALHTRGRRMQSPQQRLEVAGDDDLAVECEPGNGQCQKRADKLGEVAREWSLVAAA